MRYETLGAVKQQDYELMIEGPLAGTPSSLRGIRFEPIGDGRITVEQTKKDICVEQNHSTVSLGHPIHSLGEFR